MRNLVSSLSAYLRSYLIINLVSVEQLSYSEFLECLPSPTCIASLGLEAVRRQRRPRTEFVADFSHPRDPAGRRRQDAVQRRSARSPKSNRCLLDGLFRLILRDLHEAWTFVTQIEFSIETIETEPQFLQILAPTEAVVAVAIEIRIGDSIGMMNIAMPSIIIKMMRQKFDQQWTLRKSASTDQEQARVLNLIRGSILARKCCSPGPELRLRDLIHLEEGDVLSFEYPASQPIDLLLNGKRNFAGRL